MDAPPILYVLTPDGVGIGYWSLGDGFPLILAQIPSTHAELEWRIPEARMLFEAYSGVWQVVRLDCRGTRLSDRTRSALREYGGTEVKAMGDGFMASFGSAQRAIECAISLQRAFAEPVDGEQVRVRIGVNAGEPIAEDDDLFGASVIAAARIAARAEGGQVLVANVVRELVAGKGFLFHDTGLVELKGDGGAGTHLGAPDRERPVTRRYCWATVAGASNGTG